MLNLSDVVGYYVDTSFSPEQKRLILDSFAILEAFEFPDYETKYIDLVVNDDRYASDAKPGTFFSLLERDIGTVIQQHGIAIAEESDCKLVDANALCHFLLLLPNLEDLSTVKYVVYSSRTPRDIVIDLAELYSGITTIRLYELIEAVEEKLVNALRDLCPNEVEAEPIDLLHKRHVDLLFAFIERTPCLGLELYEMGYGLNLSFEELIALMRIDLTEHVQHLIERDLPQTALDIFSLLILSKDEYSSPVLKLRRVMPLITQDPDHITRLSAAILSLSNDFNLTLDVAQQQERLNGQ